MTPYYSDSLCQLFLGDNREVLPQIDTRGVDMLLTDPPYGLNWDGNYKRFAILSRNPAKAHYMRQWANIKGDSKPFDPRPWLGFKQVILWGANHFWQDLPTGRVLVWDKRLKNGKCLFSHGETGYMKGGYGTWIYQQTWVGFWKGDESGKRHLSPCQKPVGLMTWCMTTAGGRSDKPRQGIDLVLDPFAGSGATGVAAKRLGKRAILIEIEEQYAETAARRLEQTCVQGELAL